GQFEAEALRVFLRDGDHAAEDPTTVVPVPERGDHVAVRDPSRLCRGDERGGPDSGFDLQMAAAVERSLPRDDEHDDARVPRRITGLAPPANAPLPPDAQRDVVDRLPL